MTDTARPAAKLPAVQNAKMKCPDLLPSTAPMGDQSAEFRVFQTTDELGKAVAAHVLAVADQVLEAGGVFLVALSGGSLPKVCALHRRNVQSLRVTGRGTLLGR